MVTLRGLKLSRYFEEAKDDLGEESEVFGILFEGSILYIFNLALEKKKRKLKTDLPSNSWIQ